MAENEGSWAVTLPDTTQQNNQMMQTLYQHSMQQQRMNAIQQNRELMRQQRAAAFVGNNFKDSNYATGTAADPLINKMTADARGKFAKMIHENPNMDEAELEMQMQGDLSKISQYSSAIKAGRKNIEESSQHYQQLPGIDSDALKQGAISHMIFNTDPTGKKTLIDDPNKIDLSKNFLDEELTARPELYVKGDEPLMSEIKKYEPKDLKGGNVRDHAGTTVDNSFIYSKYPWQNVLKNNKESIIGAKTNSIPATLSNGQTVIDPSTGKPMQIVDDETMARLNTPGVAAQLKRDTDAYIKKNGYKLEDFLPGSEAYKILGKHILYNKLEELTPSKYLPNDIQKNASIVDKMQLGIVDALGRAIGGKDEKHKEALLGSNYGKIRLAVNMDPTVLAGGKPYTDPASGKQFIDVTDAVGGFNALGDKKRGSAPNDYDKDGNKLPDFKQVEKVMVDPSNPGTIYTKEGDNIRSYSGKELDGLLTMHAPANGHKDLKDVKTIIDGIPIRPNIQVARQARAELEFKRRQAQADALKKANEGAGAGLFNTLQQ